MPIFSSIAEVGVTKQRLRAESFVLLAVLTVSLLLRLSHPLLLPVYYDEALHIERAQRAVTERTLLMGTEGGKYLQIWLLALVLPFTDNPLLAARTLSVVAGLLTAIGCYFLARHLYHRDDVALISIFLYAATPYTLFYDRMGMADGLLSTLAVWSLLLSLITIRQGRWWQTFALGLCLGLTAATKLNGAVFLVFPILATWFWWGERPFRQILQTLLASWLLAVPWLLPSLLDLSPQFASSIERSWLNSTQKGISHLIRLSHNFSAIAITLWAYLTPPYLLLALIEIGRSLRLRERASWLLTLTALSTLVFFLLTAGLDKFFARYILPAFPFLLIMAGRSLVALANWLAEHLPSPTRLIRSGLLVGLMLLVSLPAVRSDYLLLTNPPRFPWLPRDRQLFVDGPLAGYGIIDAAAYLHQHADQLGMIIVVKRTDNQKRTGAWGYYLNRANIILDPINLKYADPQELIQALHNAPAPVFVVLDRPSEDLYAADFANGPYAPYSTLVATFPRPGGESRIEIYQVQPQP